MKKLLYQIIRKDIIKKLSQEHGNQFINDVLKSLGLRTIPEYKSTLYEECMAELRKVDSLLKKEGLKDEDTALTADDMEIIHNSKCKPRDSNIKSIKIYWP